MKQDRLYRSMKHAYVGAWVALLLNVFMLLLNGYRLAVDTSGWGQWWQLLFVVVSIGGALMSIRAIHMSQDNLAKRKMLLAQRLADAAWIEHMDHTMEAYMRGELTDTDLRRIFTEESRREGE